ncbi:MAG: YegS/Rv2252/BmrU family lipid kinase [Clostridia bacterium]|nr:YegS/Rv2252/BmrU family lipid kinase [Clostridia bacterium]
MKHCFVINAHAGKGNKVDKLTENIHSVCQKRAVDYEIYLTESIGDAEVFIKNVCLDCQNTGEIYRFYACGGDGTVNECVNGLADFDRHELAVIPIGTGNDFVRNFGDKELFFDINAQIDAKAQKCDIIKYNGRYCINVANIGLDCEVVARTDLIKKKPYVPSKMAYVLGLIGEFIKKSGIEFTCTVDGVRREKKKFLLAFFANGGFYGGGFHSAPLAEINDGVMDICFINYVSRITFLGLVGKYKKGTHLSIKNRDKVLEYIKCKKVEIAFEKKERICIDGELEECDSLILEISDKKINLAIPNVVYEENARRVVAGKC